MSRIANNTWRVYSHVTPINTPPRANRIRRIVCDYQQSTAPRGKYYKYLSTDCIYSYKAYIVCCRSKTTEYWHVDIAVTSSHVVQLLGFANAVGCSNANHTDMHIIRTAQLLRMSYSFREPSAVTLRCERPEYTGCLAKKEKMSGRISLRCYCAVVEYIF